MDAEWQEASTKVPLRWQDHEWDFEIRGGVTALKGRRLYAGHFKPKKRGKITTFSRRSRFRMYKMIGSIEWPTIGNGLFVTLTFPDERLPMAAHYRMRKLAEWFRKVENYLGHKISALWRIEWEERLTGEFKGRMMPHYHLIIFSVRYFPYWKTNGFWKQVLKWDGYVRTETKRLCDQRTHGIYIAKYAAKPIPLSSLVNVSYSRIDGKHWGYYRQNKLPRAKSVYWKNLSLKAVAELREIAASLLPWYSIEHDAGFVLMGQFGRDIAAACHQLVLDAEDVAC